MIVVHGRIVSVNQDKKLVTLQGADGKQATVHVYNPYNLAAAKPGEPFVAKFYEIATVQKLAPGQSPACAVTDRRHRQRSAWTDTRRGAWQSVSIRGHGRQHR